MTIYPENGKFYYKDYRGKVHGPFNTEQLARDDIAELKETSSIIQDLITESALLGF